MQNKRDDLYRSLLKTSSASTRQGGGMSLRLPPSKRSRRSPGGGSTDRGSKSCSKQRRQPALLACYTDKREGQIQKDQAAL